MVAPTTVPGYKSPMASAGARHVRFWARRSRCASRRPRPRPKISANLSKSNSRAAGALSTRTAPDGDRQCAARAMGDNLFPHTQLRSGLRHGQGARSAIQRESRSRGRPWCRWRARPCSPNDDRSGQCRACLDPGPHILRVCRAQFSASTRGDEGDRCGYLARRGRGCSLQSYPPAGRAVSAWLALKFRRPFPLLEERREHLVVGSNSRQHHYRGTGPCRQRGMVMALAAEVTIDVARTRPGHLPSRWSRDSDGQPAGTFLLPRLSLPDYWRGRTTRLLPYARGPTGVCVARDLVIDRSARAADREPWEFRYDNLALRPTCLYNVGAQAYDSATIAIRLPLRAKARLSRLARAHAAASATAAHRHRFRLVLRATAHAPASFPDGAADHSRLRPGDGGRVDSGRRAESPSPAVHSHGQGMETTSPQSRTDHPRRNRQHRVFSATRNNAYSTDLCLAQHRDGLTAPLPML